jgi:hypothetical protein
MMKKSKPYKRFRELMVGENQCGNKVEWGFGATELNIKVGLAECLTVIRD